MTDCGVCLCGDIDGYAEFFHEEERKCRKPTKCFECGRPIEKGAQYKYVGGKFEGEMWSEKLCLICDEILRVFSCDGPTMYGDLWDDMQNCVFPDLTMANKCFQKLSPTAKQYLLDRWNEWKF